MKIWSQISFSRQWTQAKDKVILHLLLEVALDSQVKRKSNLRKQKKHQLSFMVCIYSWFNFKQNMMIYKEDIMMSKSKKKKLKKLSKNRLLNMKMQKRKQSKPLSDSKSPSFATTKSETFMIFQTLTLVKPSLPRIPQSNHLWKATWL